ncbi:MAG: signal peptide peptidase SppA [Caulobacteraceae bacterium]|nr:signal peptide peptidase SppA [Caulobacteraceae bacterium]
MKQFFITVGGVFVGLLLFFVVVPFLLLGAIAGSIQGAAEKTAAQSAVLELDLREGLRDQDSTSPFGGFGGPSLSVMRVVDALRAAEKDNKVKSVLVRLPEGGMAPAAADELRQAFKRFRLAGKPIVAHSQGLYPDGMVVSTYELGAATGEFWMQPNASFQATGMATSEMFLKRLFDRYQVRAEYEQRYEYKNAVNPYLYDDFTPAHRESTLSWMTSIFNSALNQAARDRRLEPAALKAAIEGGPWSAEEARARRLIDRVGGVAEVEHAMLERAGRGAKIIDFEDYAAALVVTERQSGPAIAVINAEGPIITGRGESDPFARESVIHSDEIAAAFEKAIEDKDVKAIVFRVSSPGGSDTASEQIGAAVRAAKAAGKPVVVSMGTYAASGGYWISADASHIVANPSTLTGSIGVFGGKFVLGDLAARFGVDMRDLSVGGEYANAFTSTSSFTPAQRAAFAKWMDRIYDSFIQRVSEGRKIPAARVREIAKGRVWTGAQALQLHLVDELGGFNTAVARAKALARIPADQEVRFKRFPAEKTFFEALSEAMGVSETSMRSLSTIGYILTDPHAQSALDQIAEARMREGGRAAVLSDTPRVDR